MTRRAATLLMLAGFALSGLALSWPAAADRVLRVCADPDNLPYSNARGDGFEDRIAALIAADLHATVQTTWGIQRLGFLRRTLLAHRCDVVMGTIASGGAETGPLATTRPYYRSGYVFVTVRARALHLVSFDDKRLRRLRIGLHALAAGGANVPPAESIARRGLGANVVGFTMYDDADTADPVAASPAGRIIAAVAGGAIDVAAVWGPFAGYFGKPYGDRLAIAPIASDPALPALAFSYDIAIGVRRDDLALRDELDAVLARHRAEVTAILHDFDIPLLGVRPQ